MACARVVLFAVLATGAGVARSDELVHSLRRALRDKDATLRAARRTAVANHRTDSQPHRRLSVAYQVDLCTEIGRLDDAYVLLIGLPVYSVLVTHVRGARFYLRTNDRIPQVSSRDFFSVLLLPWLSSCFSFPVHCMACIGFP